MISFLLGKRSSGPRMTTTLAANSRLGRGYCAPARRGSIAACMAALFPFGCLLDDPVTFAINEDHAPKIRSCKDRPLCEAREDEIAHSMRRPLANTLVRYACRSVTLGATMPELCLPMIAIAARRASSAATYGCSPNFLLTNV